MAVMSTASRPWSKFNRHGWSKFGRRQQFPNMEHDEPNKVTIAPGQQGEIVWQFTKAGTVNFACLVPGHYEAGMKGKVQVSKK